MPVSDIKIVNIYLEKLRSEVVMVIVVIVVVVVVRLSNLTHRFVSTRNGTTHFLMNECKLLYYFTHR
jgi:hypothetical protein